MSRCFPFPPSGISAINEALIDSIKLQDERQNNITDRVRQKVKSSDKKKERKREKKENKRDRKDRKRDEKLLEKLHRVDSVQEECKGKQSFDVHEQSNITEEHGLPVDPQNVSCSSHSTGNSSKRKRHSSPASSIQGIGNVIRIRLSSQRKDDPSCSSGCIPSKEQSSSENDVMSVGQKDVIPNDREFLPPAPARVATTELVVPSKTIESVPPREDPNSSGRVESREPSKKLSSCEKKMLKRESLSKKLFENLVPPELENGVVVDEEGDDDNWLFGKEDIERPAKRLKKDSDEVQVQACMGGLPCSAFALLQPCSHFLSNVGVYALPFTVPF